MQQHALHLGAAMIINARFETSRVAGNASQGIGSVEILVYGTALSLNNQNSIFFKFTILKRKANFTSDLI